MMIGSTVALGPILPTDLANLLCWGDDPTIARHNEPYAPINIAHASDFWLNSASDPRRVFFAIRARTAPDIIGHVQITGIEAIHRSAVIGILLGKSENRGKGFGKEAMLIAIDYCWRHLNLSRLTLHVHNHNENAIALYEKLGFVTEGIGRQAEFIDGQWVDLRWMALVRANR